MDNKKSEKNPMGKGYLAALAFFVLLVVFFLVSVPGQWQKICRENHVAEHLAIYRQAKQEKETVFYEIALYTEKGPVSVRRSLEKSTSDELHEKLETAILPLSFEELRQGYITYIPNKVKLKGAAYKDKVLFLDLSKEILDSSDLEKAMIQLALSIDQPVRRIELLTNGQSFKL